jgi:AraC-like DNA-binding protein
MGRGSGTEFIESGVLLTQSDISGHGSYPKKPLHNPQPQGCSFHLIVSSASLYRYISIKPFPRKMKASAVKLCEIHELGTSTREHLVSARQVQAFEASGILFAGHTDAGRGYRFVRHAPTFTQILACTGGEGRVLVDGGWQRCRAGHVYLTAQRTLCAYEIKPGTRWQVCWVIYEGKVHLPDLASGQPPRLIQADASGLRHAIEGLCHEASDPAMHELWATLVHRQTLRLLQPSITDPRLEKLWHAVRQDLGGAWSLQRMARCAGMSAESLRRLCLTHHERPPLAHLTWLRMQFAADLLACTKETISSIATRVGYEDAFAFSNAFKRELGQPPSRHRTRHTYEESKIA